MLDTHTEFNTNKKIAKGLQTNRRMDGNIILPLRGFDPVAACALCNYGPHFYDRKKATRATRQKDRETERQRDRQIEK